MSDHAVLQTFFDARSIAIIGASREPQKVGHQILKNLNDSGRKLFPINPTAHKILGHTAYPSILDVQETVDLAVIAVPVQFVQTVIHDCVHKKVKAVLIITAGFAETSKQGKLIQAEIHSLLKDHHIQLLGPNSLGLLCPPQQLNCSFASNDIHAGHLAIISQSGAMLTALFTEMNAYNVGCSFAISLGNKAGISENDALEFAVSDPHTKTIGIYLESFADLPRFFELCSQISKKKPIIVLKGGRTKSGQSASVSHTAALATNDILLKAGAEQFGYVMVDTIEEFIQTIFFLEQHLSLPENTMVITNAGGPGVNTVDVSETKHLTLAQWSKTSAEKIKEELPMVHVANPLDLIGDANQDRFEFAVKQAQRDPQIDSILVIITQQAVTNVPAIINALIDIKSKKPVAVGLIGGERFAVLRNRLRQAGLMATEYPNEIIDVLAVVKRAAEAKYVPELFSPQVQTVQLSPKPDFADNIDLTFQLLGEYGFRTPIYSVINTEKHADNAHIPSYAKTANLSLAHKKDLGALYGVVHTKEEARDAYEKMKKFGNAVLYQEVIQADTELLLGANRDPQFGLYIAVGLGGSWTNVLSDRTYIFLPTTKRVMKQKLLQTKAFSALEKLSQEYQQNLVAEVIDHIFLLQKLMLKHPEIQELEINPLMINAQGIWAADVKIKTYFH